MAVEPGSIEHLTQIISQVVGPSFLLGAVASFISMLFGRMGSVVERIRSLNAISDDDPGRAVLKADLPRLHRRIALLHRSILLAIGSGIMTTLLIIIAFVTAFLDFQHTVGSALMFVVTLALFCASLGVLAREVLISVNAYDHF